MTWETGVSLALTALSAVASVLALSAIREGVAERGRGAARWVRMQWLQGRAWFAVRVLGHPANRGTLNATLPLALAGIGTLEAEGYALPADAAWLRGYIEVTERRLARLEGAGCEHGRRLADLEAASKVAEEQAAEYAEDARVAQGWVIAGAGLALIAAVFAVLG